MCKLNEHQGSRLLQAAMVFSPRARMNSYNRNSA